MVVFHLIFSVSFQCLRAPVRGIPLSPGLSISATLAGIGGQ
jgi:hypothetical protein